MIIGLRWNHWSHTETWHFRELTMSFLKCHFWLLHHHSFYVVASVLCWVKPNKHFPVPLYSLCLMLLNQGDSEEHSEKCLKGAHRCLFDQVQRPWSFLSLVSFSFVVFGLCDILVCSLKVRNQCFRFLETSAPHSFSRWWWQMAARGFCLIFKHFIFRNLVCLIIAGNMCTGEFAVVALWLTWTGVLEDILFSILFWRGFKV